MSEPFRCLYRLATYLTLEPDGRRLPAKQFEVGSIPAGVSFKQGFDVVGPAAHGSILCDSDRCVPNMGSDDDDVVTVSSADRAPDYESGSHGFDPRTDHHHCRLVTDVRECRETFPPRRPEGGGRPSNRPPLGSSLPKPSIRSPAKAGRRFDVRRERSQWLAARTSTM